MYRHLALFSLILATCLMTLSAQAPAPANGRQTPGYVPATDEMLWKPDPANWLSWRRTLDGHGYSPLDQIDRSNVSRLKMVWGRGMAPGTIEATPLVYNGVMYLPGPGDVIQAIDARTGDLLWSTHGNCRRVSGAAPTAISRSGARRSSTAAPTTRSTRWTSTPAPRSGRPR